MANYHDILNKYFDILKNKYLNIFSNYFNEINEINLPIIAKYALVIVEPRKHINLEFVIKNACYYCRGWSLYIFHSKNNKDYICNFLGDKKKYINLIEFTENNIDRNQYSNLLKSKENFWDKINAKNVLIFQTDSCICRFGIEKYIKYDYIGAPFSIVPYKNTDLNIRIGNGGFSLRNKEKILEILNHNINLPIETKQSHEQLNEDVYYAYWLKKNNYYLPDVNEAIHFSVEALYYNKPIGFHAPEFRMFNSNNICIELLNLELKEKDKLPEILILYNNSNNNEQILKYYEQLFNHIYFHTNYNVHWYNTIDFKDKDINDILTDYNFNKNIFIIYLSFSINYIPHIKNLESVRHLKIIDNNFGYPNWIYKYKNSFKQLKINIQDNITIDKYIKNIEELQNSNIDSNMYIEKNIHQIWGYYDDTPPPINFQNYIDTWKKYNPDWKHKLWLKHEIDEVILKEAPELWDIYNNLDKKIKQVDYARLVLLYIYGGIYVDVDYECLKNIDILLTNHEMVFCCEGNGKVSNAIMCTKSKNTIIYDMLTHIKEVSDKYVLDATGPHLVTKILLKHYSDNYDNWKNKILIIPPNSDIMLPYEWYKKDFIVKYRNNHTKCKKDFGNSYCLTHWAYSWRKEDSSYQDHPLMVIEKNIDLVNKIFYGIKAIKVIDITNKFIELFIKNNKLIIPIDTHFNKHFGDPTPDIYKRIYIQFNNIYIELGEADPKYYEIEYNFTS